VRETGNIVLKLGFVPSEVVGDKSVTGLRVQPREGGETEELAVGGVFVAVGTVPETALLYGQVELDEGFRVVTGEDCAVAQCPGVFAAGDIRRKPLYQITTAVADGAVAAAGAGWFLNS
jgi:thioredoxin reductase (NADPH)